MLLSSCVHVPRAHTSRQIPLYSTHDDKKCVSTAAEERRKKKTDPDRIIFFFQILAGYESFDSSSVKVTVTLQL